jgi:hypothetical protein
MIPPLFRGHGVNARSWESPDNERAQNLAPIAIVPIIMYSDQAIEIREPGLRQPVLRSSLIEIKCKKAFLGYRKLLRFVVR